METQRYLLLAFAKITGLSGNSILPSTTTKQRIGSDQDMKDILFEEHIVEVISVAPCQVLRSLKRLDTIQ